MYLTNNVESKIDWDLWVAVNIAATDGTQSLVVVSSGKCSNDAVSYMIDMYTLMDMPLTYAQIPNNWCITEASLPFETVRLGFGFRRIRTEWACLHSEQLVFVLDMDFAAAMLPLDDAVWWEYFYGDGLDLTLYESATPWPTEE